ncbi:MAG: hypothetical protein AAF810_02945 [Cyanobacteria bacterium P01_D01_bin.36]
MNGSRPKPPSPKFSKPKPPPPRKPRRAPSPTPWIAVAALFVVYLLMGLLLSIPTPPYWVWIAVVLSIPLLVFGCNRPVVVGGKTDRGGLMAYLGGLVMAIALAVSANYIGSENSFDNVRFFTAIAGLGILVLLAVLLTAIAAIISAQAGTRLMTQSTYGRSVSLVIIISFLGLCVGGVMGLTVTTVATV